MTWRSALAWFQAEISRMPGGALLDPEPESSCEVLETGSRGSDVQGDLATEQVGRDAPEDQVRVGDGRLGAAAAVAERAGVGTR